MIRADQRNPDGFEIKKELYYRVLIHEKELFLADSFKHQFFPKDFFKCFFLGVNTPYLELAVATGNYFKGDYLFFDT